MINLMNSWQAGFEVGFRSDVYPGVIEKGSSSIYLREVGILSKLMQERIILLSDLVDAITGIQSF